MSNIIPRGDERAGRRVSVRARWRRLSARFRGGSWALALLVACERRVAEPAGGTLEQATKAATVSASPKPTVAGSVAAEAIADGGSAPEVIELLSLPGSAYQASLSSDDDAFYVLTGDAAYRLRAGEAPAKRSLDLGFGATVMRARFVFWSGGAIMEAPKRAGALRRLSPLPERPQGFYSSPDHFAWLERGENGAGRLFSLSGTKPRERYVSAGPIDAVTLLNDWIFFAERVGGDSYRVGGVRAGGGPPVFTAARRGRSPSSLVGQRDLYYYDGNGFEVRRLSPDLAREDKLSSGIVCSPIAVAAERVFCGSVEGVFELREGKRHRLVAGTRRSPFAAIAANAEYLAWVAEGGANQLVVKALRLSR